MTIPSNDSGRQSAGIGGFGAVEIDAPANGHRSLLRRFLTKPSGVIPLIVFLLIVAVALLAPFLGLQNPNHVILELTNAPPSAQHLLGGDASGRDVFSRLIWGSRITLVGALITVITGIVVGVPTGLIAGYYGGASDRIFSWISDGLQSVPGMIVLLVVAAGTHSSFVILMITIGIFMAPGYYRLTRSSTLSVRNEPYTDAARVAGLSNPRIIARHILVVISAPIFIQTALSAGVSMGMQAGLQFLGIGDASVPSWGAMMNSAFQNMSTNQFLLLPPALALGLTIAVLAMMGSALAEAAGTRAQPVVRVRRRAKVGREVTVQGFTATPPAAPSAVSPATLPVASSAAPPSSDVAVRISGLRVRYGEDLSTTKPPHGAGSEVLHGIGLDVRRGEVLGIVGESGSGKSQTVFALLDLLPAGGRATADELWFDGKNLLSMSPKDRRRLLGTRIGYIPQEPMTNLDPSFTIGYQLCEPMRRVLSMSRAQARQHASALLDRVGIEDPARVMKAYPHEISGGMAQRVLIAGAIAGRPSLLVADEPTTALDVTVQAEVLELLRELQEADGTTLIIVTHNFGVVADICDRVAVMKHGDVIEVGDVETIFAASSDPYTAELIGASLDESESRHELDAIARASARSGADGSAPKRVEEPVR